MSASASATRARIGDRVVAALSRRFARRVSRRSFLLRTAVVGSALAIDPLRYVLRPGTAYASLCGPDADCGSGWTVFCCSINGGANTCPPGSIPGGWWKADGSGFCGGGARYYIDCNATCSCGCGPSGICGPGCYGCGCHCGSGSCDERRVCCNQFRYGQCHPEACVGPVVCRVVTCVPPWQFDRNCSAASATANATALHDAPCLHSATAAVAAFGAAAPHGSPSGALVAPVVGIDATPTGRGYWLAASDGGVFAFGDAGFHGSLGNIVLNRPIVDVSATRTGRGYWLVASDGGVFCFGDARFHGSLGGERLNQPIVGIAGTPSGGGYWLVASDGGVFCFGDARFHGSTASTPLIAPMTSIAATPRGDGYWLLASDGGVFALGAARFFGSLGGGDPFSRGTAVGIADRPQGDGYWIATSTGAPGA